MTVHRQELADRAQAAFSELHDVIAKAYQIDGISPRERAAIISFERILMAAHEKANRIIRDNSEIKPFFGTK